MGTFLSKSKKADIKDARNKRIETMVNAIYKVASEDSQLDRDLISFDEIHKQINQSCPHGEYFIVKGQLNQDLNLDNQNKIIRPHVEIICRCRS